MNVLLVALGGGIGAALRYGVSLLPISGEFPGATLLTNIIGAFVIGLIAGQAGKLPSGGVLFLKTGVCGGFTTFSTFSLETVMLLQNGRYGLGAFYIVLSLACCLIGVMAGLWLGGRVGQQ